RPAAARGPGRRGDAWADEFPCLAVPPLRGGFPARGRGGRQGEDLVHHVRAHNRRPIFFLAASRLHPRLAFWGRRAAVGGEVGGVWLRWRWAGVALGWDEYR